MANVFHFSERECERLLKGFSVVSDTDGLFSHELDTQFSGVRTVHVTDIKTYPLQQYNRNLTVGTGSRYGTTQEVGDSMYSFEMTQDVSLSLSVDKGNNKEQLDKKKAGAIMAAHRDEQIVPELDRYRLNKWAAEAGIHYELTAATSKANIVSQIITAHNVMRDKGVKGETTLLISYTHLPDLKLSSEWIALDSLGGKSLPKGTIGEFDGMNVIPVASANFPAVPFMILHKRSVIAPAKVKEWKGHVDPPGLSGDLMEFRMMHDAFVLPKKANGVLVACPSGSVVATPTITVADNKATIASTTAGATVYYTLDGSDPRYSKDRKTYPGSAVVVAAGDQIRAYAAASGKWNSAVAEKDI